MRTVLLFPRGSGSYPPWHWQSPPLPSNVSIRKWLSKWTSFWRTGRFPLPNVWRTILVPDRESKSQSFSLFHVLFSLLNSSCELHNTVTLVCKWICLTLFPRSPWAAEHFLPSAQSHARSLLLGGISEDVPAEQVQRLLQVRAGYCEWNHHIQAAVKMSSAAHHSSFFSFQGKRSTVGALHHRRHPQALWHLSTFFLADHPHPESHWDQRPGLQDHDSAVQATWAA